MLPLLYKKLFIYLIPLSYTFGEYNAGVQYRLNTNWAIDVNAAYVDDIQNTWVSNVYEDIFNTEKFYYSGVAVKAGLVSLYPRGINPFKTDYNTLEFSYKKLGYSNLDFVDNIDSGKVFNISEKLNGIGVSWHIGYDMLERDGFKLDGFIGFGLQFRFRNITTNSYGYDFNSSMFVIDQRSQSFGMVPLFNAGFRIGFKVLNKYDEN